MSKKLCCLTVDDEPLALELIKNMLKKVEFIDVKHACPSAREAAKLLKREKIDLAFLDIQMPGITGLDIAKQLQEGTMVIFTTAFEEYALEGFNVSAVDYLLKPLDYDRLLVACHKALNLYQWKTMPTNQNCIYINASHRVIKIQTSDIIYIEGMKDYVKIFIQGQDKPVLTRMNLKSIQRMLPEQDFRRIHKSYLINWNCVLSWEKEKIKLKGITLPVGAAYKALLKGN
ncbi:MAG TPA: LytTR family DNA-binding domain-containing protein [Flavobacteriales bacterium]|nr:LytTR family DNA-binding domain-containing protein [Flavobacteriales bacterium]